MSDLKYTIPAIFNQSVEKNWNRPAFSFVSETPYTYREVQVLVKSLMSFLNRLGIKKSTKVAILSDNSPNWAMSYLA
ncbi:MAG TPA: AMP-binding protein, partial [Bacteroidales bacterium]|nr:AMP-binding protein [Bacteroidales bacterium]